MENNLFLVIGEDAFLIRKFVNEILEKYVHKDFKDIDFITFSDKVSFENIVSACLTPPVMSAKKVVVLNNIIQDLKITDEEFINFLESLPGHLLLIIVTSAVDKPKKLFNFLEKKGYVKDFRNITDSDKDNWIKRFAREFGKDITSEALEYLKVNLNDDLYAIRNEVFKVASILCEKDLIDIDDVEKVISININENIFKLAEELGKRSFSRSIKIFDALIKEGEYIPSILAMVNRHFRILLQISYMKKNNEDLEHMAKKLGLPKFIINKYLSQLKYFNEEVLKNIIQEGCKVDLSIKLGKVDPKIALEVFISKICA